MNKKVLWSILILLAALMLVGWEAVVCNPDRTPFQVERQARAGLEELPGAIGVTFVRHGHERESFTIRQGRMEKVAVLPEAPPTSTVKHPVMGHPFLSPVEGYDDVGPFSYDPTGRFVAAALGPERFTSSTALRIVDTQTDEPPVVFDDRKEWEVHALAWAPDSSALAVVRAEFRRRRCVRDLLLAWVHGSPDLKKFHLFVIDGQGNVITSTVLMENVLSGRIELVWME